MSNQEEKIHYRKAFDSPYLSSADVVEPVVLTIAYCTLSPDKTKKTKDEFNTAHFAEQEIRRGEKLKPMILNATNSKTLKTLTELHTLLTGKTSGLLFMWIKMSASEKNL